MEFYVFLSYNKQTRNCLKCVNLQRSYLYYTSALTCTAHPLSLSGLPDWQWRTVPISCQSSATASDCSSQNSVAVTSVQAGACGADLSRGIAHAGRIYRLRADRTQLEFTAVSLFSASFYVYRLVLFSALISSLFRSTFLCSVFLFPFLRRTISSLLVWLHNLK